MARRLPKGTTFRGSYAPAPISYDKPQGDYTKIAALGEKALPLADKILTPTLFRLGRGAYNLVEGLFEDDEEIKEGAAGYQQKIKDTESSARQEVANKLLGNPVKPEQITIDRFKDIKTPRMPEIVSRESDIDDIQRQVKEKLGLRPGTPAFEKAVSEILNQSEETVAGDLSPQQTKRLEQEAPEYIGQDLMREYFGEEEGVGESLTRKRGFPTRRGQMVVDQRNRRRGIEQTTSAQGADAGGRLVPEDVEMPQTYTVQSRVGPLENQPVTPEISAELEKISSLLVEGRPELGPAVNAYVVNELLLDQGSDLADLKSLSSVLGMMSPEERRQSTALDSRVELGVDERFDIDAQRKELRERRNLEMQAMELEGVDEDRAVEQFKQRASEVTAGVPDEYVGVSGLAVTSTPDEEIPAKTVEQATETVKATPTTMRLTDRFMSGDVSSIGRMDFNKVRSVAALMDPRTTSQDQAAALLERYEDEAIPKGLFELLNGDHKKRAAKQFRKEFGLYAGQATKEERAYTARREQQQRQFNRAQQFREDEAQALFNIKKAKEMRETVSAQADMMRMPAQIAKIESEIRKNNANSLANKQLAFLRISQNRTEMVKYEQLRKKLMRSLTPGVRSKLVQQVNPETGVSYVAFRTDKGLVPMTDPRFNTLLKDARLSRKDRNILNQSSKDFQSMYKARIKKAGGTKSREKLQQELKGKINALNAALKAFNITAKAEQRGESVNLVDVGTGEFIKDMKFVGGSEKTPGQIVSLLAKANELATQIHFARGQAASPANINTLVVGESTAAPGDVTVASDPRATGPTSAQARVNKQLPPMTIEQIEATTGAQAIDALKRAGFMQQGGALNMTPELFEQYRKLAQGLEKMKELKIGE